MKVLPTPREQLKLSRELMGKLTAIPPDREAERRAAVATAVAHLQAVARRWPGEAAAVAEATVLEAEFLVSPTIRAYPSGEEAARRGLTSFEKSSAGPMLHRALGIALQETNRLDEAEQAFSKAERHSRFKELSVNDQLEIWLASGLFYERYRKNPREAAARYRSASRIPGLSLLTQMGLTRMSLERIADIEKTQANEDLKHLERLLTESLRFNYTEPGEIQMLRSYQAAAVKYKKKLQ